MYKFFMYLMWWIC